MSKLPPSIGPYRIHGVLGQGSAGIVYRGEHCDTGQAAAIKTLHVVHERLLQSLRREIHTLSRLRHPGIVRILDTGLHADRPWYAMELLDGRPLRDANLPRTGDLKGVSNLVRRLCAPLAFLHGEGLVHRDLKPDNVLIQAAAPSTKDSRLPDSPVPLGARDLRPVIVDFGLVSRFEGELSRESLEIAGLPVGTVEYMAPEQARGGLVDARADLYALGCILYELLTGVPPFAGSSAIEILRRHMDEPPRPPSELAPEVPEALDDLVLRLLAKDPRRRIGYADAVAAALARFGDDVAHESSAPRAKAYLYRPGFSGRADVLAELGKRLARLEERREGGMALIAGESGVGKTRLALELARLAEHRDLLVLTGECIEQGGRPLHALLRPLQALADRCRVRGASETERLLGPRGRLLAHYERSLAALPGIDQHPEPVELPAEAALPRLYGHLSETFEALCEERPVLLLLDDLQWSDELTLGWLEHVTRFAAVRGGLPLLVLGTYRDDEVAAHPGSPLRRWLQTSTVTRIVLGRLDEAPVAAIVADMLALEPAPSSLSRYLALRSAGNPFFVAEYLRTAVTEALVWRDELGRWQVSERSDQFADETDFAQLPLPHSIRELVGRRLEDLPASARALSQVVAVVGQEASVELLARMLGVEADPVRGESLQEAIFELIRRQVLEETAGADGLPRVRFVHDQIRSAAAGTIPDDERSSLHRSAALGIEAGSDKDDHLEARGHHWEQAAEPLRARDLYLRAAREATRRYAYTQAERMYRAYLRLSEPLAPERIQARIELGREVLSVSNRTQDALAEFQAAVVEAEQGSDLGLKLHSILGLGSAYRLATKPQLSGDAYAKALELARECGDRLGEAQALCGLANAWKDQGGLDQPLELYERALLVCRESGLRRMEGITLTSIALVHKYRGDVELSRQLLERALVIHREVGDLRDECTNLVNLAAVTEELQQYADAEVLFKRAMELARKTGKRSAEGTCMANLAILMEDQDRCQEALGLYETALRIFREIGDRRNEGIGLNNLVQFKMERGEVLEARRMSDESLAVVAGFSRLEGLVCVTRTGLERRAAGMTEAEPFLARAETIVQEIGIPLQRALCFIERGHLTLARDESAIHCIQGAEQIVASLGPRPLRYLIVALKRLQRAEQAHQSNERHRLFRGECVDDLPAGLRGWLVETGQLDSLELVPLDLRPIASL